ncbi:putative calcium-binding protein CML19 [Tanacetum coccineum]
MNLGESSTSSPPAKFFGRLLSPTAKSPPLPIPHSSDTDDIHQVFNYFDENGDGVITASELQNRLKTLAGDEVQLSDEEAEMAVRSSDADGDGVLGFDDFTKMMKEGAEEELREAFRMYSAKSGGVGYYTNEFDKDVARWAKLRYCGEVRG